MQTDIKTHKNIEWIKVVKPEKEALAKLFKDKNLPETLLGQILEPTLQTQAKSIDESIFISLHFPILHQKKIDSRVENVEIDFILNESKIFISSYKNYKELDRCFENFEEFFTKKISNNKTGVTTQNVFEYLLRHFYKQVNLQLDAEGLELRQIQKLLFIEKEEVKLIQKYVEQKNILFEFKSILRIHKNLLSTYLEYSKRVWTENIKKETIFQNEFQKIVNSIDTQTELLEEIRVTADFIISHKDKQLSKLFTGISFLILPLTFVSGFMGMNTKFPNDLVQSPFGTFYILVFMCLFSLLTLVFLKIKKYI